MSSLQLESLRLGTVMREVSRPVRVVANQVYQEIGIRSHGRGVFDKEPVKGVDLDEKQVFWIEPGDFLFNIIFAWEGAVAIAGQEHKGRIASHRFPTFRVNEDRAHPRYLLYYFATEPGRRLLQENSPGSAGRNRTLDRRALLKEGIPLPQVGHQRRIVDFLDRKTAAVDDIIAKKERLVALLQEKRQALITQAVTTGLDPSVPMKESGVPAFGTIPLHWDVLPLRRVVSRFVDYRGRTPTKVDDGIPLITAGAVRDGRINHARAPEYMAPEEYDDIMRRGRPEVGDVVFTTEAPLGEVALVEDTAVAFAQRIILFKVDRRRMTGEYLWLFHQSEAGRNEVLSRASGSTAEGIRADRLRASQVVVPPLDEQRQIVAHVRERLPMIDRARTALENQIEKLREYRQALITAAVTGKLELSAKEAP